VWHFTGAPGSPEFITTCGIKLDEGLPAGYLHANRCFTAYKDTLLAQTSSALTLTTVSVQSGPFGARQSISSNLPPAAGTATGTAAPIAMSAVAQKKTSLGGRKGRGRMFLPGIPPSSNVDQNGLITTAARTAYQTALNNFWGKLVELSVSGVSDRCIPMLLHSDSTPPTVIDQFILAQRVGWIRGRL
jgi:hypothetical protein